jgi:uncharacterized membrane protein
MWKQIKAHPRITLSVLFLITLALTILIGGYRYQWAWTGLTGDKESYKTLYDWLQLLIIPAVLAIAGYVINLTISRGEQAATEQRAQSEREAAEKLAKTEQDIAKQRYEQDKQIALDKQHEDLLQAYLDRMAELLLEKQLLTSDSEEVRNVARARTISVLTQLNARRVGYIFTFLGETGLMSKTSDSSIVSLKYADFREVNWSQARLIQANLSGALQLHLLPQQ